MGRPKLKQPWAARKKARSTTQEQFIDDGEGTFAQLFERHPDLARRETRTITFQAAENEIPPGEYSFAEAFCMGRSCDCRRVMFMVYRTDLENRERPEHVTTIGFGWEPLHFYVTWMHGDREGAEFMRGPIIEPNSPMCGYDQKLLEIFKQTCLSSPAYVDRVRRHYDLFKRA
jgi:hypothetical protein